MTQETEMKTEMKLDATRIRDEREKRAWTQEQLAEIAGLGLRTVQRIEANGVASFESMASLSTALSIPVSELRLGQSTDTSNKSRTRAITLTRVLGLPIALVIALIVSPPKFMVLIAIWLSLWVAFEVGVVVASKRHAFRRA